MKFFRKMFLRISIILVIIGIIFIVLREAFGLHLRTHYDFLPYILPITIIFLIVSLIQSSKKYKIIVIPSIGIFVIVTLLSCIMFQIDYTEYSFESPNKSNTLIIREGAFLLGADITVYEKKYIFFMKELNDLPYMLSTDDGYEPFKEGQYKVKWISENDVELEYYTNLNGGHWEKALLLCSQ